LTAYITIAGNGNPVRLRNWRAAVLGNKCGTKTLAVAGKSPHKAERTDTPFTPLSPKTCQEHITAPSRHRWAATVSVTALWSTWLGACYCPMAPSKVASVVTACVREDNE